MTREPDERNSKKRKTRGGTKRPIDTEFLRQTYGLRGWSQKQFAEKVGCDVRQIERALASGTASRQLLSEMCQALGVPPETLVRPTPVAPPPGPTTPEPGCPGPPPNVPSPLLLPPEVPNFVGREGETGRLVGRLGAGERSVGLTALRGMGGIGKTSLAVRVAHRVKDRFPDGVVFLRLRGMSPHRQTPAEAMAEAVHAITPLVRLPSDPARLSELYRLTLGGRRALVVLDDAADELHVKELVTVQPPVTFLITSRRTLVLPGFDSILLGVLADDEAVALLKQLIPEPATDHELVRIAALCGNLPLAVRVAGDFLRIKPDWPAAEYIAALEQERLRYLKAGSDPAHDVEAVLRLSAAQLCDENPNLATCWSVLAGVFQSESFDAESAGHVLTDEYLSAARDRLSELSARSLLEYDPGRRRYRFHDLLVPVAVNLFGEG